MKPKPKLQRWIPSITAGAALLGATSLCWAADPIVYGFDADLQGWYDDSQQTNNTVEWNSTNGVSGGGCLMFTIVSTNTEADPRVSVDFHTAQYMSVEFDLKIDPASGTAGDGGYGNLQVALRDAANSWDSIWYGSVANGLVNGVYHHFQFMIPRVGGVYKQEASIQIQLQASAGYSGSVTGFLDNVTVTPLPNPWLIDAYTSDTASAWAYEGWANPGGNSSNSWNTADDAGGGYTPLGCMQLNLNYPAAWSQFSVYAPQSWYDPSRWTYVECDLKVDAANSSLFADGTYGTFGFNIRDASWGDHTTAFITLDTNYTSWTHVKLPMPVVTSSPRFEIRGGRGTATGPVRLLMDNFKMSSPITAPSLTGLTRNTDPGGVKISVNGPGDQWNREALCIPSGMASMYCYFWINQMFPVVYSMTLTNFPSPSVAPGFAAHIFIVNEDTIPDNQAWNETYGGCDWNAADLAILRIENGTNTALPGGPGVVVSFEWKTNSPASNPTNEVSVELPLASANGTWQLMFTDNVSGQIIGPSGVVTNFTLPDFTSDPYYNNQFSPLTSFLQWGIFKNDAGNTGLNDYRSGTLTHVAATNAAVTWFDDNFVTGLTNTYAWRLSNSGQITWIPRDTAYWLKWTINDGGFTAQSAGYIGGPWNDAGIVSVMTDSTGTNRLGAIPGASLPAGPEAYFRLINTNAP